MEDQWKEVAEFPAEWDYGDWEAKIQGDNGGYYFQGSFMFSDSSRESHYDGKKFKVVIYEEVE